MWLFQGLSFSHLESSLQSYYTSTTTIYYSMSTNRIIRHLRLSSSISKCLSGKNRQMSRHWIGQQSRFNIRSQAFCLHLNYVCIVFIYLCGAHFMRIVWINATNNQRIGKQFWKNVCDFWTERTFPTSRVWNQKIKTNFFLKKGTSFALNDCFPLHGSLIKVQSVAMSIHNKSTCVWWMKLQSISTNYVRFFQRHLFVSQIKSAHKMANLNFKITSTSSLAHNFGTFNRTISENLTLQILNCFRFSTYLIHVVSSRTIDKFREWSFELKLE